MHLSITYRYTLYTSIDVCMCTHGCARSPIFSTPAQRKRELEAMIRSGKVTVTTIDSHCGPSSSCSSSSSSAFASSVSSHSSLECGDSPKCCSGCFETALCPSCTAEVRPSPASFSLLLPSPSLSFVFSSLFSFLLYCSLSSSSISFISLTSTHTLTCTLTTPL